MRISTKCSLALHLLIVLEVFRGKKLTSEILAQSTGSNPVIVRNIMGSLKKAGIIDIQRGAGGANLAIQPENITIWDVYKAVDTTSLEDLVGLHPNPSPICPVGKNIYALLEKPYSTIAKSVKQAMSSCTLKQLLDDYRSNCQVK